MAIRKDVNDMLNNLKQEEPPKEKKQSKSKFDNMSVDDLVNVLNDGKETKPSRKAPIRELKRIPPSKPKEQQEQKNIDNKKNQENNGENKPKKKKIVISGELPDYEAIRQKEIEKDKKEKTEKNSRPAENKEKDNNKQNKDKPKKGFFSRVRELMYVSADDDKETEEEYTEKTETSDDDSDENSFTIEEIKESTDNTIASIEEAISAITDEKPVKEENKTVPEKENKPAENKPAPVSKNKKKKSRQNNNEKKKTENKPTPQNKAEKPESAEEKKSETNAEKPEKAEEKKSETKAEKSENAEEKKSETKTEKSEKTEEKKPETKAEKSENTEEKKSESKAENSGNNKNTNKKNQQQNSKKKKKSGNKPAQNNSGNVKTSETIIENIKKDAENAISEIENKSENKKEENIDISVEEEQDNKELNENPKNEKEKTDSKKISNDSPREIIITQRGSKSSDAVFKDKKYAVLFMICIILAIVGLIAIVNTLISHIGGGKSKNEVFEKAVYPAVITNIHSFESPSELTSEEILSASIWSAVIDEEKLSKYNEIMGSVIIPASDVEEFAVELFGEDIPELNHTTVGPAESKFYYNQEAQSYNVPVKPDTFTYLPEVTSVSKKSGEYIVNVDYIEEHPEWMEKSVSKTAQFKLSKNDDGGYKIDSMTVMSESSST